MELYGCSFHAPHCLTWTQADGNTLCSLIHGSISGTLSCQNCKEIYEKLQRQFSIYSNAVTKYKMQMIYGQ